MAFFGKEKITVNGKYQGVDFKIERNPPIKLCFGIPSAVRLESRCLPHWFVICLVNSHKMKCYVLHRHENLVQCKIDRRNTSARKFQRFTQKLQSPNGNHVIILMRDGWAVLSWLSKVIRQILGFGFTTVWDWLSSLIGK